MARGRVIGVIPARLGSTRFPGKVLAQIGGRPLVQHVYERLAEASSVDEVLVATDSAEVEEAVSSFGGRALIVKEPYATGSDRVAAAVRHDGGRGCQPPGGPADDPSRGYRPDRGGARE